MSKTVRLPTPGSTNTARDVETQAWLLRQKIMLPNLPDGFLARPALDALCDPWRHRLTAVHAPGGFGKTTFLAAVCRREREAGRVAAWLRLDAEDDPRGLVEYLSLAIAAAGVELLGGSATVAEAGGSDRRLNRLVHSIEVHGEPCLLVLDEVDSLDAATVGVADWLLRHAPANLHVALACRVLPRGLDVATVIAQGRGVSVTAADLRFATREIARFFDGKLSRRELAELAERSRGWPIALWIHRNSARHAETMVQGFDLAANWFDKRLMSDLSDADRALVLDAGLFDWLQEDQVDEVLGAGAMRQLRSTPTLAGLLQSAGGASGTAYFHPLLRQYCIDRRLSETPARYRAVHRALAGTLGRAGQIVSAVRHARQADEPRLAGEILERAGGWRLWFNDGVSRLHAINALLTNSIIEHHPRLAILRCMALTMAGETDAAQRLFADARERLDDSVAARSGGDDSDVAAGAALYGCMVGFLACAPVGSKDMVEMFATVEELANADDVDIATSGAASYAMVAVEFARSDLVSAADWARRARTRVEAHSRYFTTYVDLWTGMIAAATGRIADAEEAYARAEASAKPDFMQDPGPALVTDILIAELDLERNRVERLGRRAHPLEPHLAEAGAWMDVYAAAAEVLADVAGRERGPEAAARVVREALAFARRTSRATLVRALSAMHISDLVAAARLDEAERLWTDAGFPARLVDCAELATWTWREMEAVACAGLRLAAARGRFQEGRELVDAALPLCRERSLVRTGLRVLALAMALEHRAGEAAAAADHLAAYLRTFPQTDYVRPMVGERSAALAVLDGLGNAVGADLVPAAAKLRGILVGGVPEDEPSGEGEAVPALSKREREILERLEHAQDKALADALNLSVAGVRYHVSSLFRKLGAHGRLDAVRRARSLGLLPPQEDSASGSS